MAISGSFAPDDVREEDPAELLARTPLLQGVGRAEIAELARHAVIREVTAGAPIVSEGELDDCYHVLLSGRAAVIAGGERRRELLPGDGFGEIAVLHRVPRTATVLADQDAAVMTVPGEEVRTAVATRGGLLAAMVTATAAGASEHAS